MGGNIKTEHYKKENYEMIESIGLNKNMLNVGSEGKIDDR